MPSGLSSQVSQRPAGANSLLLNQLRRRVIPPVSGLVSDRGRGGARDGYVTTFRRTFRQGHLAVKESNRHVHGAGPSLLFQWPGATAASARVARRIIVAHSLTDY
jgi:hypothetical protein